MTREQMIDEAVRRVITNARLVYGLPQRRSVRMILAELHILGRSCTVLREFERLVGETRLRGFVESALGAAAAEIYG